MPSSVLMLAIAIVLNGFMAMLDNVQQDVAVCGLFLLAFAEFSGKHGAQVAMVTELALVTAVITSKAQVEATTIAK
jgi:hypothetical protein